ncbi:hypothetical protein QJS10_CPB13g01601 [Acorus calamus]|uniref:Uncharacterized protein n=1 Tax=Acorus calamus TaxID=4465 RepID=A0AAV9DFW8_ACOCL|nr:hypothetical protein QJS10_CPB13g01601 [Acorus calamus]
MIPPAASEACETMYFELRLTNNSTMPLDGAILVHLIYPRNLGIVCFAKSVTCLTISF